MKKHITSWLFWLNFLLLQWFFVRLARAYDTETGKTIRYFFIKYPYPLTGWWANYIFAGGKQMQKNKLK